MLLLILFGTPGEEDFELPPRLLVETCPSTGCSAGGALAVDGQSGFLHDVAPTTSHLHSFSVFDHGIAIGPGLRILYHMEWSRLFLVSEVCINRFLLYV